MATFSAVHSYSLLPSFNRQRAYKLPVLPLLDHHLPEKSYYFDKNHTAELRFWGKMATMGRGVGPIICLLLVVMDVVAGILGIEAQIAQNKESFVKVDIFECRQPSHQAYKLGVAALILLAVAHALANALGGCVCVFSRAEFRRSSPNKQLAAGSLIFSWIILIIAFSLLVIGTVTNSRPSGTCGLSHQHLLAIGGILCFIHGLFLVPYYVSASAISAEEDMRIPA